LLVMFIMGVSALDSASLGWNPASVKQAIPSSVPQDWSRLLPFSKEKGIPLEPYAAKVKATLSAPRADGLTVDSIVPVTGKVEEAHRLSSQVVWVHVEYKGNQSSGLPSAMDYYMPLKNGTFHQSIRLFKGKGNYQVTVRLPSEKEMDTYYPIATFTVTNSNPKITRDIEYTVEGLKHQMKLEAPLTGYASGKGTLWVKGNVSIGDDSVLVQVRKGQKSWRRKIPVENHRFAEPIPLLYGKGLHEVQVLLPDKNHKDTYVNGASFFVQNSLTEERTPIVYTTLYDQRGIHLIAPVAGGETFNLAARVAGRIDPDGKDARKTTHLIVRIKKGKNKATYFLPVKNYQFDSNIWLRFGPGTYDVTLYVPEITSVNRDYFRFFAVARYQVKSEAKQDLRHLLPSRGIESDHPTIQRLAQRLTRDAKTNREKAKAVYLYVARTMNYDMEKYRNNTFAWDDSALKSLRTRSGVCQDYVFLTLSLLRSLDIPSRFVEGHAGGQRHAWVEAWLGGRWVTMDPTWGSGYITPDGRFVKKVDDQYFDPPAEKFAKTHKRIGVVY